MSAHLLILVAIAVTSAAFIGGLYLGYELGVKETEQRWSEAVSKANYQRDMERACA